MQERRRAPPDDSGQRSQGEPQGGPCFRESDWIDAEACTQTILEGGDLIWGIAVNVSRDSCVLDPRDVLRSALEVGERTGKPLLYGMRNPTDWPIARPWLTTRKRSVQRGARS